MRRDRRPKPKALRSAAGNYMLCLLFIMVSSGIFGPVNAKAQTRPRVASGTNFTVLIKSDGTLWAWGDNLEGELGDGTTTLHLSPEQIGTDNNWLRLAPGVGGYRSGKIE